MNGRSVIVMRHSNLEADWRAADGVAPDSIRHVHQGSENALPAMFMLAQSTIGIITIIFHQS